MGILSKGRTALRIAASPLSEFRERRRKAPLYTSVHINLDPAAHLREASDWLRRAQDFGSDRGVSYGTALGSGFLDSYPETTGYIICTFLDLAEHYRDTDYLNRAIEMGEWEADIQMTNGAVMGGKFNTSPTPAVFNTGMVLLGWAALYRATGNTRFRDSAERAGQWLVDMQEPTGEWIRGHSQFANAQTTVYNVKAAWGLAEAGAALHVDDFLKAAERSAQFALARESPNGWYSDCCLQDGDRPLLHTIAYTMQGLVGVGKITGRQEFIKGAIRTADSLMGLMGADGFIPGRIDGNFNGAADWCCLTGTAQTSIVWSQLARLTGNHAYAAAAVRANDYLMARHDVTSSDLSVRGGLAGSWPVWGSYGQYLIPNWATKFLCDALLEQKHRSAQ